MEIWRVAKVSNIVESRNKMPREANSPNLIQLRDVVEKRKGKKVIIEVKKK